MTVDAKVRLVRPMPEDSGDGIAVPGGDERSVDVQASVAPSALPLVSGTGIAESSDVGTKPHRTIEVRALKRVLGSDDVAHAYKHLRAGADEIDADLLAISHVPANFTRTPTALDGNTDVEHLRSTIEGIDLQLGVLNDAIVGLSLTSDNVENDSTVAGDDVTEALDTLKAADTTNASAIGAETTARAAADTALSTRVAAISNRLSVPAGVQFSEIVTEQALGGFWFDPAGAASITFEFIATHQATNGTLDLRLYDMGDGVTASADVLRSTLSIPLIDVGIRRRKTQTLTTSASPGTNVNQISTSGRVYELRGYLNSSDASALAFVSSAGLVVTV